MKQPPNRRQNFTSSEKTTIVIVSSLLVLGVIALIALVGYLFLPNGFQLPAREASPTPVTPEPTLVNPSQLDMLFLKSTVSADQATVTLDIRLTNKGVNPITLTNDDLSVTPEGGTAAPPTAVTPVLPQVIAPGANVIIAITFPHPNTPSVVLRILDLTANYSFQ